jgi:hypothetical protein
MAEIAIRLGLNFVWPRKTYLIIIEYVIAAIHLDAAI